MGTVSQKSATHEPVFTDEGGGIVVTCSCSWLRFAPDRTRAEEFHRAHCPKQTPKPADSQALPRSRAGAVAPSLGPPDHK